MTGEAHMPTFDFSASGEVINATVREGRVNGIPFSCSRACVFTQTYIHTVSHATILPLTETGTRRQTFSLSG